MNKVNIVLVEDEFLIREGIKALINLESNFEIIEEFSDGQAFVDFVNNSLKLPDIVLMDIKMPNLNGIETTKILMTQYPALKIIALSNYNSKIFIANMLEVGAVSYLPKSATPTEIFTTINKVFENGFYYDEAIISFMYDNNIVHKSFFDNDYLSSREKEVLTLICKQKSATEIGEILHISPRTVDGHRNNLLLKTESKNVVGLVVFAIKNNLFFPGLEI